MAFFRFCFQNIPKSRNHVLFSELLCVSKSISALNGGHHKKNPYAIIESWRSSHTFLSRLTAQELWKGVTSVSNAGRRKGRARASGRTKARDLNRGQYLGCGKVNMLWPGLNAPILQGREIMRQQELPPDIAREKRMLELRDKMISRKRFKLHPLERGWCGDKLPGRNIGPPEMYGEESLEGFESRVLEFKTVMHGSARGKVRVASAFVVVGNKNGLAGFALSKSVNALAAAKSARNKAGTQLRYINRDKTSVLHDFFCEFGAVKVFVEKRSPGHGLVCHKALKAICEVIGIKDIWCKAEGPTGNYQNLTKAFFIGLMSQKFPQQLANEKGLYLVETKADCGNYPRVIASPDKCRTEEEIGPTELLDYRLHLMNGKVEAPRKKYEPFYINFPCYAKKLKDMAFRRNQDEVRLHLKAKYGEIKSFLNVREEKKESDKVTDSVKEV